MNLLPNIESIGLQAVMALTLGFLSACSISPPKLPSRPVVKGEYIFRHHDESFVPLNPLKSGYKAAYPWEEERNCSHPKITKDFFRCKGSNVNTVHFIHKEKEVQRLYDCGGPQRHSLPLREGKEFIYPILIDLLNYIQTTTGKRVVITCGHCCPEHNTYSNPSPSNQTSKHMLGAEVDFYVQGMEQEPEKIVELIFRYYREQPKYQGIKDYTEFKRHEKDKNNAYLPWYNKEIMIKLFRKHEGRDFDNRHPYSYVCLQVRYDSELNEKVTYSWDKAFRNFLRW